LYKGGVSSQSGYFANLELGRINNELESECPINVRKQSYGDSDIHIKTDVSLLPLTINELFKKDVLN
jgi:hypothetical protein